jgi:hypothetical protein
MPGKYLLTFFVAVVPLLLPSAVLRGFLAYVRQRCEVRIRICA